MLTQFQPKTLASPLARDLVARGRRNLWFMRQVEGYGVIDEPYRKNDWLYIPYEQDMSSIPVQAINRVEQIQKWNFKIQGMIVAHEAPMALAAPKKEPIQVPWNTIGKGVALAILGTAFITIVSIAAFFGMLVFAAVQVDPALIVVLKDGSRVEVYRWID
jgi:hypothetical protein